MKKLNTVGFFLLLLASCSPETNKEVQIIESNLQINVQTEAPIIYHGNMESHYSGVVEAKQTIALSFATMGTVTEVMVEEGQSVSKGQLLAKVDPTTAQNAYEVALSKHEQAEDAYARLKPMRENGTLPEIKWVEVETGLAQAKSAVAIAQKNLKDANLFAPSNGVIGKKSVQAGMNIIPAMTALELLNIQSVFVKIPVSENEIGLFSKGDSAQITINSLKKTVTGTVKEIGVSADILSRTYPVKIEVLNSSNDIRPGMICSVQTFTKDNRSGILISNKALQNDVTGKQFIYLVQSGQAKKVFVQTIALVDNKVLIQGDVPQNTSIITSGQQKLRDGTPVKVIN